MTDEEGIKSEGVRRTGLTDKEVWTLINALHTASEAYQNMAGVAHHMGHSRIADQFLMQVTEANVLSDRLQDADAMELLHEL